VIPTPEILERAYDLLCATRPFRRWSMPDSADVEFHVVRGIRGGALADYCWDGRHIIRVALGGCSHTWPLLATVAHEMVHLRQRMLHRPVNHGHLFKRLAEQVCREHGWDPRGF